MNKNVSPTGRSIDAMITAEKNERIAAGLLRMQQTSSDLLAAHGEWEHTWKVKEEARKYKAHEAARDHFTAFITAAADTGRDMVRFYTFTQTIDDVVKRITIIGYQQPKAPDAPLNIRIFVQNIGENTLPVDDDGIECYLPSTIDDGVISYSKADDENGLTSTYTYPWDARMADDEFEEFQTNVTVKVQTRLEMELEQKNAALFADTRQKVQKALATAAHAA